jgi:O-antigen/teichoic acid export membrane protein
VLGDQALVSGVQFLTTVMLVRELGLETFGVYSLLWLGVMLAVGMQRALIAQPAMAIAPRLEPDERRAYLSAATTLQLLFSVGSVALTGLIYGLVLAAGTTEVLRGTWLPLVASVCARQLHGHVRAGFFLRGRRIEALWNDALAYGGQALVLGLLMFLGRLDVASALWAVAGAGGLASALGLARQGPWCRDRAQLQAAAGRHWGSGRWLAALQGLRFVSSNAFLVAGGVLLGVGAVGAFKAAQSVIGVLHVGLLALENVVPIRAAHELAKGGRSALLAYLGRLGLRAGTLLGGGAALLAWRPQPLLNLIYGQQPSPELLLALRGLCLLYLFALTIALLQIAFRSLENTRPIFVASVLNLLLTLAAAEPVVARFGFTGMVVGIVAQQALVAALLVLLLVRTGQSTSAPDPEAERAVMRSSKLSPGSRTRTTPSP